MSKLYIKRNVNELADIASGCMSIFSSWDINEFLLALKMSVVDISRVDVDGVEVANKLKDDFKVFIGDFPREEIMDAIEYYKERGYTFYRVFLELGNE